MVAAYNEHAEGIETEDILVDSRQVIDHSFVPIINFMLQITA